MFTVVADNNKQKTLPRIRERICVFFFVAGDDDNLKMTFVILYQHHSDIVLQHIYHHNEYEYIVRIKHIKMSFITLNGLCHCRVAICAILSQFKKKKIVFVFRVFQWKVICDLSYHKCQLSAKLS